MWPGDAVPVLVRAGGVPRPHLTSRVRQQVLDHVSAATQTTLTGTRCSPAQMSALDWAGGYWTASDLHSARLPEA